MEHRCRLDAVKRDDSVRLFWRMDDIDRGNVHATDNYRSEGLFEFETNSENGIVRFIIFFKIYVSSSFFINVLILVRQWLPSGHLDFQGTREQSQAFFYKPSAVTAGNKILNRHVTESVKCISIFYFFSCVAMLFV